MLRKKKELRGRKPSAVRPPAAAADLFESDNNVFQARAVALDSGPERHSITPGDADWVKVTLAEDGPLVISTDGPAADGDTVVLLIGPGAPDGENLYTYDDDGGRGLYSRIVVTDLEAGEYYIKVRGRQSTTAIEAYDLVVSGTLPPPPTPDDFEPDDTAQTAHALVIGATPQTHSFHSSTDVDFVTFTLQRATKLRIETNSAGDERDEETDTTITLYRNGRLVETNDDSGPGLYSRIDKKLKPGTYTLRVTEVEGRQAHAYLVSAQVTQ